MRAYDINRGSITEFLRSINYFPERKLNGYWLYKTPWQEQKTGSLKVDLNKNLWIDFSSSFYEGGTLIDLILRMNPLYSVKDVIRKFNNGNFSFQQPYKTEFINTYKPLISIIQEDEIKNHPDLCNYLSKDRGITPKTLSARYLKAYQYKMNNKDYWNLGAINNQGGYNLFAKNFKCATKQGYTLYKNSGNSSMVYFEGIIDFLSFLIIYPNQEFKHDYCILNTVNNMEKAIGGLSEVEVIISFLDNDSAGSKATEKLRKYAELIDARFFDYRGTYREYKDLNDYLIANNNNTIKR